MSGPAPLRCLFSKSAAPYRCLRRNLHSSKQLHQRPDFPKIPTKAPRGAPRKDVARTVTTADDFKAYSEEDKRKLTTHFKYTPAQLAAIEAGEAAIDPKDLAEQAMMRDDPFAFEYYDDFATIHPVVDKPIRAPEENYDPKLRYKNEDEIAEDFVKFIEEMPEGATRLDYMKFTDNVRLTVGKEEAERKPVSSLAPEIPKGLESLKQPGIGKPGEVEIDPAMKRLMRQTGFSLDEIKRFRVKNLVVHRVVNQTKMGKIQSMYFLTVAGNGRGLLGIGEGKSAEAEDARRQAHYAAIRNVQPIPRYEDRTIYGDVKVKMGAVELELMTRPPGFGIRCQDKIFEMCRCAGISDLAARVTRSRNPMNTIKATFQALLSQKIPDEVARGLGKKLVDVRKVYYGGNV
ncbi:hypothetical protein HO173_005809 [Letharia columbiana]|uniref:Small ribosomal subunit protein uS5m n=1 Tax=Letharia columbiana TaxID=112416 RepID=A0A8H6L5F1_9LECA|nr:uncharacterized protein HO173_005809 [Letharia columbiana]KAF6236180.1 hypothetical protein HO173_005809 [Letharia columbiana]